MIDRDEFIKLLLMLSTSTLNSIRNRLVTFRDELDDKMHSGYDLIGDKKDEIFQDLRVIIKLIDIVDDIKYKKERKQ